MAACKIFFVLGVIVAIEAAKFPKNWKACKNNAKLNECMKESLQQVIPFFVEGIPSLGVHSVDPLHFETLSIGKGTGPVSVDLEFKHFDVHGVKNMTIESVDTDWKEMKVEGSIPTLVLNGKYKVDGKVLVLPVLGEGDCQLDLKDFKAHAVLYFSEKANGNKKYYNIDKMDFQFDCSNMKLRFEKLFNGDKALGDQMNTFLNENWEDILKELRPAIAKSFSLAFTQIGNRVFSKIPKDQITPA